MPVEVCKQVCDDKQARRLSQACTANDIEGPYTSNGQIQEREAFEDAQMHLSSRSQDHVLLGSDQSLQGWPMIGETMSHPVVEEGG